MKLPMLSLSNRIYILWSWIIRGALLPVVLPVRVWEMVQTAREERLRKMVISFFEDFMDYTEVTDNGRVFRPISIHSCRCIKSGALMELLQDMRKEVGLPPAKTVEQLRKEWKLDEE